MRTYYKVFEKGSSAFFGLKEDDRTGSYKKEAVLLLVNTKNYNPTQRWIIRLNNNSKIYNYSIYYTDKTVNEWNCWLNIPMHQRYDRE